MKRYRVYFEETNSGYVDVFADNKDHAIHRLRQQPPLRGEMVIETEEIDYLSSKEISTIERK